MSSIGLVEALFPRTRIDVLSHLYMEDEGLHLRELERRSGVNSRHLSRELHALRDAGILLSKKVGNQVIYRLNPACPIYDELRGIVRKTVGLAIPLRTVLEPFRGRIRLAYIYGSTASGANRVDSDVDLMIVGEVTLRELSSPLRAIGRELSRAINPTLYTDIGYEQELAVDDSFVHRVHHGPRIDLVGGAA